MLYIIAKVKRKTKLFNLKHEIILGQKEKRSKMLQVKVISKNVRKTIVSSFMFLLFICKYNTFFTTEPMK